MHSPTRERLPGISLLLLTMLLSVFPLLSMLSAALQPQGSVPAGIQWPSDPQWGNFVDAWKIADITPLIWSSLLLVGVVVPVTALFATMAGYALGQLRIPGGAIFFVLLLPGLTLPHEATIVPLYYQMRDYGLLNSRLGLMLALIGIFLPFAVFWMRAHFLSVPGELSGRRSTGHRHGGTSSTSRCRSPCRRSPRCVSCSSCGPGTTSSRPSC